MQVDEIEYRSLLKRIADLEKLLNKPVASLYSRVVKGVQNSPTLVVTANADSYGFIDGLDLTADIDGAHVLVDFAIEFAATIVNPTYKFQVEVDGQNDERNSISWVSSTGSNYIHTGAMEINTGGGSHRFRILISSTQAGTLTFTDQARYMRVTGIINNRRRS